MVSTVRAQKDKESLAEDESYEDFSPTFTYPVCILLVCDDQPLLMVTPSYVLVLSWVSFCIADIRRG